MQAGGQNLTMPAARTNSQWIQSLEGEGQEQAEAILDLRELLLRACLYTLVKYQADLSTMDERERNALAEDCAQDAVNTVLSHLGDFRGDSKFSTWAYKFGINIALTRARREKWKAFSLDSISEDNDSMDWLEWKEGLYTGGTELPSLQTEVGGLISKVIRAELTPRQRQVLKWIAFDEVPMDVVTERLDTNRNAVYKLLHDARKTIKNHLAAQGYPVEEIYELFQAS